MKGVEFEVIGLHFDNLEEALGDGRSLVVMEGSSRSGKTYAAAQWLVLEAISKPGTRIAVLRENSTTIKKTVWEDYLNIAAENRLLRAGICRPNKQEMTLEFYNGSKIFAMGMNEKDKLHGLRCVYYHLDEATDCRYESWKQVNQRCEVMGILTYNPKYTRHWIYDRIIPRADTLFCHSTYKDNPYLPPRIVREIEAYDPGKEENRRQGTADLYSWQVYGLGKRAVAEGAIFRNISASRFYPVKDCKKHFYCLDWGYARDPCALVEVREYDRKLYARTLLYEVGLTIVSDDPGDKNTVVSKLEELGIAKDKMIICDSAEPSSIETLRRKGYSAVAVSKIKDSIIKSINIIKSFQVLTPHGDPLLDEVASYIWALTANGENCQPLKPVDKNNHSIDALRYGVLRMYSNAVDYDDKTSSRGNGILAGRDLENRYGRKLKRGKVKR